MARGRSVTQLEHTCVVADGRSRLRRLQRLRRVVADAGAMGYQTVLVSDDDAFVAAVTGRRREPVVTVESARSVYASFEPERQVQAWAERTEQARAVGFHGLVAVADMRWTRSARPDRDALLTYEERATELHRRVPFVGVCDYSGSGLDLRLLLELAALHPVAHVEEPVLDETFFVVTRNEPGAFRLVGELDGTVVEQLERVLRPALSWHRDVTLCLGDLTFVDVSGMTAIARFAREIELRGRRLVLRDSPQHVHRLVDTGLWPLTAD
jgi:anti-anti-sigma factor